jgi:hypothetical protein
VRYIPGKLKEGCIDVHYSGKADEHIPGLTLPESVSQAVFFRQADITGIDVGYFAKGTPGN